MAIALDATTNSGRGTNVSTCSWSHTCSGNNRLLVVCVGFKAPTGTTVSSLTYNGVALTFVRANENIISAGTIARSEIWYLVSPATGANSISLTLSASASAVLAGAISLTEVDQSSPLDAHAGQSSSGSTISVVITTVADGAWIIDSYARGDGIGTTVGANQTQRWKIDTYNTDSFGVSTVNGKSPAGSETMDWTMGGSKNYATATASFKPAASLIQKALSDTGSGSDSLAGIKAKVAPSDSGSGADSPAHQFTGARLNLTDQNFPSKSIF
jgi:hypothetical protein